MRRAEKEYQRLTRSASSFPAMRCSLWLGRDHLVKCQNQYFTEDYRRFYYRDIQTIVLQQTYASRVINILLVAVLAVLGWLAWVSSADTRYVIAVFAGLGVALLTVSLVRGATCRCVLQTETSREELVSVRRMRTARRVLARLQEKIDAAQGPVNLAELEAAELTSPPVIRPARWSAAAGGAVRPYIGRLHVATFVQLLVFGAVLAAGLYVNNVLLALIGIALLGGLGATNLGAIVSHRGTAIGGGLRAVTIASLLYLVLVAAVGYGATLAVMMVDLEPSMNQSLLMLQAAARVPQEYPTTATVTAFLAVLLGLVGLVFHRAQRRSSRVPPPLCNSR